jgi:hypothetical protein
MTSVITCVTIHVHGAPHKRPIKTRLQTRLRRTNWRTFEMNAQTNLCLISPSYVSYLKLNVSSQDSHSGESQFSMQSTIQMPIPHWA